jgi:hypothetical protein
LAGKHSNKRQLHSRICYARRLGIRSHSSSSRNVSSRCKEYLILLSDLFMDDLAIEGDSSKKNWTGKCPS